MLPNYCMSECWLSFLFGQSCLKNLENGRLSNRSLDKVSRFTIMLIFILLVQLFPHETVCIANLKYFETLSYVGATTRVKRSSDGSEELITNVKFQAFEKKFEITLKPDTHLLAEGFTAALVHKDGSSSNIEFDRNRIFSGFLTDNPKIRVYAHMENALWMIQIYEKEDIYAVEPAWRLLDGASNPNNDTMVAYKASDLNSDVYNSSKFCGVEDHETKYSIAKPRKVPPRYTFLNKNGNTSTRGKRTAGRDATCLIYLVGDYSFFKGQCNGYTHVCSVLMYAFVDFADDLFRRTIFANNRYTFTNLGIRLKKMQLYSSFTEPHPAYATKHFNENIAWDMEKKLFAFGNFVQYMTEGKDFCVNHLFTDYAFPGRILGLAWLGTICQKVSRSLAQNSGVTSGSDLLLGHIPTLQMNLVFAHELGHNFGSEHDPKTPDCSRQDTDGGNFLMWHRSVNGRLENHNKFSPCSARQIAGAVSKVTCLQSRQSSNMLCGNGMLDENEECDVGAYGYVVNDTCCDDQCKLKKGAVCSPMNYGCCDNCSVSKKGKFCQNEDVQECKLESSCNGKDYKCPTPEMVEDWTDCRDHGQCYRGMCRGMCEIKAIREARQLKGCMCQTNENGAACKLCCFDVNKLGKAGLCQVYDNETFTDGKNCYLGSCKAGVCKSEIQSTILRIYNYLPSLTTQSELATFMRANIVLVVVVLSLFVWLPPIYFINKADNRQKNRRLKNRMSMFRSRRSYARRITIAASTSFLANFPYQPPSSSSDEEFGSKIDRPRSPSKSNKKSIDWRRKSNKKNVTRDRSDSV